MVSFIKMPQSQAVFGALWVAPESVDLVSAFRKQALSQLHLTIYPFPSDLAGYSSVVLDSSISLFPI
jgi:hypothetical protein